MVLDNENYDVIITFCSNRIIMHVNDIDFDDKSAYYKIIDVIIFSIQELQVYFRILENKKYLTEHQCKELYMNIISQVVLYDENCNDIFEMAHYFDDLFPVIETYDDLFFLLREHPMKFNVIDIEIYETGKLLRSIISEQGFREAIEYMIQDGQIHPSSIESIPDLLPHFYLFKNEFVN